MNKETPANIFDNGAIEQITLSSIRLQCVNYAINVLSPPGKPEGAKSPTLKEILSAAKKIESYLLKRRAVEV